MKIMHVAIYQFSDISFIDDVKEFKIWENYFVIILSLTNIIQMESAVIKGLYNLNQAMVLSGHAVAFKIFR